jgi:hypothetical protein
MRLEKVSFFGYLTKANNLYLVHVLDVEEGG